MGTLTELAREMREYPVVDGLRRLFDERPIQCTLYVTDRCNLDCAYCTEYDNSRPHPTFEDLSAWLHRIRELGTYRVALVGGEPLMHPDIVRLVRLVRDLGMTPSITTNGFLLTPELVRELEEAGLATLQISVDRMTPHPITRKSFRTVLPKLDLLRDSSIRLHITGVIFEETLDEAREVLRTGMDRGIPSEVRLVHADPSNRFRVNRGDRARSEELLEWMRDRKREGAPIHTSEAILDYQLALLRGEPFDWVCAAGYKIFFVSAQGRFWLCSMRHTDRHILDVTPEEMRSHYHRKDCQDGCGVYCAVSTSMIVQEPMRVVGREVAARARRLFQIRTGTGPAVAGED